MSADVAVVVAVSTLRALGDLLDLGDLVLLLPWLLVLCRDIPWVMDSAIRAVCSWSDTANADGTDDNDDDAAAACLSDNASDLDAKVVTFTGDNDAVAAF